MSYLPTYEEAIGKKEIVPSAPEMEYTPQSGSFNFIDEIIRTDTEARKRLAEHIFSKIEENLNQKELLGEINLIKKDFLNFYK